MKNREWEWRVSEIPTVGVELLPDEWLGEFWKSIDSLIFQLNQFKMQLADDGIPPMEEIEQYIDQIREELIPIQPPQRPVVLTSNISSVEPQKGCPGDLMVIRGAGFGDAEEVTGTVRPSAINRGLSLTWPPDFASLWPSHSVKVVPKLRSGLHLDLSPNQCSDPRRIPLDQDLIQCLSSLQQFTFSLQTDFDLISGHDDG